MEYPRVLLADDSLEMHLRVRELLREDFEVVGTVQNGQGAIQAVSLLNPDLIVLDISMPGLNGFQVASQLRESGSKIKVIILTMHDQDYIEAAFSAGARDCVCKSRVATDLIPALQAALRGEEFTSPLNECQHEITSRVSPAMRLSENKRVITSE